MIIVNSTLDKDSVMAQSKAGEIVSKEIVERLELDKWFTINSINNDILQRIDGLSYKANCPIPITSLRYLRVLHKTAEGDIKIGELICNESIAQDLIDIFKQLYLNAYPIEKIILIDEYQADDETSMRANNSSAFNFRTIYGTTRLSNHSYGLSIDINPLYNPYVKYREDGSILIQPSNAQPYTNRNATYPYKIVADDLCCKLFKQHGFTWGGDWQTIKDYQHFEKR